MSATQQKEMLDILQRVQKWPAEQRLVLAERMLSSLHADLTSANGRGVPVSQVRGLAATDQPPPDDNTVRQWIEEHRLEKYGR